MEEKMASAPVAESHNSPEATGAADDGSSIRQAKPGKKRLILTITILFSFILGKFKKEKKAVLYWFVIVKILFHVSLLIPQYNYFSGFPFLLKSTEIYRSPLPFAAIDSLNNYLESNSLSFPYQFQVVLVGFGEEFDGARAKAFEVSMSDQIRRRASNSLAFSVSVTVESGNSCFQNESSKIACKWRCGAVELETLGQNLGNDVAVDEIVGGALSCSDSAQKVYTAVVVNGEEKVKVVVGKYRHFWISGKVTEADAISVASQVFVEIFMDGGLVKGKGEFIPVGADGSVVLSFNLLHSNPSDWIYDW